MTTAQNMLTVASLLAQSGAFGIGPQPHGGWLMMHRRRDDPTPELLPDLRLEIGELQPPIAACRPTRTRRYDCATHPPVPSILASLTRSGGVMRRTARTASDGADDCPVRRRAQSVELSE
jgi:hypothetical protein